MLVRCVCSHVMVSVVEYALHEYAKCPCVEIIGEKKVLQRGIAWEAAVGLVSRPVLNTGPLITHIKPRVTQSRARLRTFTHTACARSRPSKLPASDELCQRPLLTAPTISPARVCYHAHMCACICSSVSLWCVCAYILDLAGL